MEDIQSLLAKIEELQREIDRLQNREDRVPLFSFSKIKDTDLETLFSIRQKLDRYKFNHWFNSPIEISNDEVEFLKTLIDENIDLIQIYHEEDLKINFIAPILKKVNFFMLEHEIRGFYNEKIEYETDKFILKGEADFIVSKGIRRAEQPYFFIQEFKRAEEFSNPRPQLLAEMVVGLEKGGFSSFKGAYIIGAIWNFVILEKIENSSYIYYISHNFDSTKIDDLIKIYKNLLVVKKEILSSVSSVQLP